MIFLAKPQESGAFVAYEQGAEGGIQFSEPVLFVDDESAALATRILARSAAAFVEDEAVAEPDVTIYVEGFVGFEEDESLIGAAGVLVHSSMAAVEDEAVGVLAMSDPFENSEPVHFESDEALDVVAFSRTPPIPSFTGTPGARSLTGTPGTRSLVGTPIRRA